MISQRSSVNMPPVMQEITSLNLPDLPTKAPISFHRSHNFPVRCYESVMPPPPHNMLTTLNNNNSTKTYNRNSWHNHKRTHRDVKNDRQVTQPCDKETNASWKPSHPKKSSENKNVKCLYERNAEAQTIVQQQFYGPASHIHTMPGICHNHLYTLFSSHHQHNGFHNKQRYYTHRQDRCNDRNKKQPTAYNAEMQQSLVNTLMERFLSRSKVLQIKDVPVELLTGGQWDTLSKQIWDAFIARQQTEETYKKKLTLWKYLYTFIRSGFPRYGLFLVGSTMSGFGSNSSDVDMCLLVRSSYVDQRSEAVNYLEQIQHSLKQCVDFVDNVELIWAKVPILKFRDACRNLEVDLNCNNAVGIRNTHLLYCYANMDWRVRPLVLVAKLWASANDINDAKNMTISSYSLALMVIHYLQCGVAPPVVPCLHGLYPSKFLPDSDIHTIDMQEQLVPFHSDNTQTLGELLLGFLHYYATFNYPLYAISVRLGARVPIDECRMARSHKNDPHQWKHLCIEEPFDLTNTARSVYDPQTFERIKAVFVHSYNRLHESRDLVSVLCLTTPTHADRVFAPSS